MCERRFVAVLAIAIGWLVLATQPARAQTDDEMIVVTGSRIMQDEAGVGFVQSPPFVSLKVPADFVLFTVELESSSKSPSERDNELRQTYDRLVRRAAAAQGVTIEVGEPGDSAPLETAIASEVIERNYGEERSSIPLVLKFAVRANERFGGLRARAEAFIKEIDQVGRVEAVTGDLQYAGVTDAGRHRETLLRKIAADTQLLQSIFSGPGATRPSMAITGLEGRIQYRQSGPLELELFVPYAVSLGSDDAG
jgi:hypothetical protein